MPTVVPPNALRSAYEDFREAFRSAAEDANREVYFSNVPIHDCFTDSGDAASADFTYFVYLKDWPCRKLAGTKQLDVIVKVRERFHRDGQQWRLTKSTVYVNYLVVGDGRRILAQALHYDFDEAGQPAHPFFHVQLTVDPIPQHELASKGIVVDFEVPNPAGECFVASRIPTPDMTFASVLYCLMADHMGAGTGSGPAIFDTFANNVRPIQPRLPTLSFEALRNSLQASFGNFKSPHWFAHMNL
jgi:hypothetical protein